MVSSRDENPLYHIQHKTQRYEQTSCKVHCKVHCTSNRLYMYSMCVCVCILIMIVYIPYCNVRRGGGGGGGGGGGRSGPIIECDDCAFQYTPRANVSNIQTLLYKNLPIIFTSPYTHPCAYQVLHGRVCVWSDGIL